VQIALYHNPMFSNRTAWQLRQNRFSNAQQHLRAAGVQPLDLTNSNPTRCGLHYEEEQIRAAFTNAPILDYDPQSKGLLTARQAVSAYYRDAHQVPDLDPESILLTSSTSEAYSHLFGLLCNPGDELLVPKPSYPLFDFLADLRDVKLVPYSLAYAQGWLVELASVARAITPRTRAILLVHPNNPTGSFIRPEESQRLNALCRAKNLALIADEVFLDYAHNTAPHRSFASNREVLTFTLSGLSKISALPQMKAAWIITAGPQQLCAPALARLEVIADTYLSVSTPVQLALPPLLEQRRSIQPQLLARIQQNLGELARQLATQKSCELLEVEGGWCAILRVPATRSDEDLAIALLEERHVLVHPGHFYDFPGDGHLVISLITPAAEFSEGIEKLLNFLA
jgi:alanine-synthesizing transaminase